MNKAHREFFVKLRALCVEHMAYIGTPTDDELLITVEDTLYRTRPVSPYKTALNVTEVNGHLIEAHEEPKA